MRYQFVLCFLKRPKKNYQKQKWSNKILTKIISVATYICKVRIGNVRTIGKVIPSSTKNQTDQRKLIRVRHPKIKFQQTN